MRIFDLVSRKTLRDIPLGFMADNLSWSEDGRLLATGIPDVDIFKRRLLNKIDDCPAPFIVAVISAESAISQLLYKAPAGVVADASVAI